MTEHVIDIKGKTILYHPWPRVSIEANRLHVRLLSVLPGYFRRCFWINEPSTICLIFDTDEEAVLFKLNHWHVLHERVS